MWYHLSYIWLSTRLNAAQTAFDDFTYDFREALHHAELYVTARSKEKPAFTFEAGAVPTLFFIVMKCRVPSIRRRALELMGKAPGKELFFGARSTSEMARSLVMIEEAGIGLPSPDCGARSPTQAVDDNIMPPEERRVHKLQILKNNVANTHEIQVTRFSEVDGRFYRHIEDLRLQGPWTD